MKLYTVTLEELTQYTNMAKETILAALADDGYLDRELANKLSDYYVVAATKKGIFGHAIDKFFTNDHNNDTVMITTMRVLSTKPSLETPLPPLAKDWHEQ